MSLSEQPWEMWAVMITALGLLVTIIVSIIEHRRVRFALGLELLIKLEEQFNAPAMRAHRSAGANALLNSLRNGPDYRELGYAGLDEVIDHFTGVGLLLQKRALSKELVWHNMYHWVHHYHIAARDYVKYVRQTRNSLWQSFDWMDLQLNKIERKEGDRRTDLTNIPLEALIEFLTDETKLT